MNHMNKSNIIENMKPNKITTETTEKTEEKGEGRFGGPQNNRRHVMR